MAVELRIYPALAAAAAEAEDEHAIKKQKVEQDIEAELSSSLGSEDDDDERVVVLDAELLFRQSEYFKSMASERWNSSVEGGESVFKLSVEAKDDKTSNYEKFFRLLDTVDRGKFGSSDMLSVSGKGIADSLEVVLGTLEKSCQFLCHNVIKLCMDHLSSGYWPPSMEGRVLAVLSTLSMPLTPDLQMKVVVDKKAVLDSLPQMLDKLLDAWAFKNLERDRVVSFVSRCSSKGSEQVLEGVLENKFLECPLNQPLGSMLALATLLIDLGKLHFVAASVMDVSFSQKVVDRVYDTSSWKLYSGLLVTIMESCLSFKVSMPSTIRLDFLLWLLPWLRKQERCIASADNNEFHKVLNMFVETLPFHSQEKVITCWLNLPKPYRVWIPDLRACLDSWELKAARLFC